MMQSITVTVFIQDMLHQKVVLLMNITFRVADEELEKQFLAEAKEAGFVGLNWSPFCWWLPCIYL